MAAQSLRGLKAFKVAIGDLAPDARAAGLTAELLRKDVELRLGASGVPVVVEETKPDQATLLVTVKTAPEREGGAFAYHILVRVLQKVALVRAPDIVMPSISTWEIAYMDNVGPPPEKMPGWVRPVLAAILDQLIKDFQSVNSPAPAAP